MVYSHALILSELGRGVEPRVKIRSRIPVVGVKMVVLSNDGIMETLSLQHHRPAVLGRLRRAWFDFLLTAPSSNAGSPCLLANQVGAAYALGSASTGPARSVGLEP